MHRYSKETGERIAALRKEHNLSQEGLAEKLNISVKHLGCSERGASTLSIDILIDICDLFDTSLDYLILGRGNKEGSSYEMLPEFLIEFLQNADRRERSMFYEYVKMYQKIRNLPPNETGADNPE